MPFAPLADVRILSLALNLPGPAALMRCRRMGARCAKLEPPGGDPMARYSAQAYAALHEGVRVVAADLKTPHGQAVLQGELAQADVLLTSFRPSALRKLGLDEAALRARHPTLWQVAIVGAAGDAAEVPGHDLTYLAAHGLVNGTQLPATLFADMAGSLAASEAVLQAALARRQDPAAPGRCLEIALDDAAGYLALPLRWGLTAPAGAVGGAHAGYGVYPCRDGRVAVAALEPHFARALCRAAGQADDADPFAAATRQAIAQFLSSRTRAELEQIAARDDLPLHTLD